MNRAAKIEQYGKVVYRAESKSKPGLWYAVRSLDDNTYSCNCPGWTKRVAADGTRSCKHTKKAKELGK